MASPARPAVAADPAGAASTPIPKSYAKGVAMTPDPLEACATLAYGGDRSCAWSVNQQVVQTPAASQPKLEQQLVAALGAQGCTEAGRAFLCGMLALVGSARSVPVLAGLLREPRTAEPARTALEAIPGAEADAALRDALTALQGPAKAGLIGSIAARGDRSARPLLSALKENPTEPSVVRDAAARALAALDSNLNA